MATTTTRKLRLTFIDSEGNKMQQNWTRARENPARTSVKTLISTIIANKSIFVKKPVSEREAALITTTTQDFELE